MAKQYTMLTTRRRRRRVFVNITTLFLIYSKSVTITSLSESFLNHGTMPKTLHENHLQIVLLSTEIPGTLILSKGHWTGGSNPASEGRHVTHGFFLLSLLLDCNHCNITLSVPYSSEQSKQFLAAIEAINDHIRLYGQPEKNHHCMKCTHIYKLLDGARELCVETTIWEHELTGQSSWSNGNSCCHE